MIKMIREQRRNARALPAQLRQQILQARRKRGWSQAELGRRVSLRQSQISTIEAGGVIPRYDTILEVMRALDMELIAVPSKHVPAVKALIRHDRQGPELEEDEQPMYGQGDEGGEED